MMEREPFNPWAIAGFIVSLASILVNLFGLVGLVGTILSIIGLVQCRRYEERGAGLAITGIIIGVLLTIFGLFMGLIYFIW